MYRLYRASNFVLPRFPTGRNSFDSVLLRAFSHSIQLEDTIRPRRAILYVPGHDRRKTEKLKSVQVDCAVLDCEDGVAVNKKDEARQVIREISETFDFGKTEFAVRINSIDSGLATEDLKSIFSSRILPETLMVPKIESTDHVIWLDESLRLYVNSRNCKEKLRVVIFIESAKSLLDMRSICEKTIELSQNSFYSLEGVVFGSDDFCADIGATRTVNATELLTARQLFVIAAKSCKLQAIDMVHINFKDITGLEKMCEEGASMGFTGKQVIHPSQVQVVQKAFSPSPEKVIWAKELIHLFKQHQLEGKGAFTFRGAMIDMPLLLQAQYIVKLSEQLTDI